MVMHSTPTRAEMLALLQRLQAPAALVQHHRLVLEAADGICDALAEAQVPFDRPFVEAGTALHDAGKILFPQEIHGPGSAHETAGEAFLVAHGVDPVLARCCRTHAAWRGPDVRFEERLVALADTLWKGVRKPELEESVIAEAALRAGADRWALYITLDDAFERVAAPGPDRLARSQVTGS